MSNFFKRRLKDYIIDCNYTTFFNPVTTKNKCLIKHVIHFFLENKGFEFMHLHSILSNNSIMNHLPETPKRKKNLTVV